MDTSIPVSKSQGRGSSRGLWLLLGALILAVLIFRGGSSLFGFGEGEPEPGPAVTGATEVAVRDNFFQPAAIEVPAGTIVTWTWQGESQHNVVGDGFESPVQDHGEFAYTFRDPGTYDYRCTLHGGMNGEVVVMGDAA